MKYTLTINQKACLDLGIKSINQAHIFALFMTASTWAKGQQMPDGKISYWVARQIVCDELPLLNLKPDTVYRHMKALANLGVIDYQKDGKKDMIRVTEKGKSYLSSRYVGNKSEKDESTMSEINPSKLGNKSEKQPKNSEINPTYPITNNPITNNPKESKPKKKMDLSEIDIPKNLHIPTWQSWMDYKQQIKKPYKTERGIKTAMNQLAELSHEQQESCINSSIMNEYQGFFVDKFKGNNNGNSNNQNQRKETTAERTIREAHEDAHLLMGDFQGEIPESLDGKARLKLV